ncbi:tRNA 4-thiouridine(8) synthase ThiI [Anaerobacillus alkalidiazotrophicus]|uniref:Probable tRNA sulfurtransferase n=1 Tax=Anaerobacillus alkalidiazotrophicus TaxID=472963 RepID=A0A1S2M0L6_9BACI|nr:tRNA uracil 4-sulfurtransferase ThiI [Anaerobacillus alkalidiazotrophicus]OIJ18238.1 tRNA 4-thiouridine(8) synthase ThiI [Anaerobacillus alkalidiazotrophicus]OIJ19717.1 tRNA 4-thiouridine(8) synthase ThiI [Anaerobacillus alkalidiazotrophicus]
MNYDHIVIRYAELALKGKNRSTFERRLQENIKVALKPYPAAKIERTFGRMFIKLNGENHEEIAEKLSKIFGIHSFSLAVKVDNELEKIQDGALRAISEVLSGTMTFKVSAKRANKGFPINSQTLNYEVGSYILRNTKDLTVNVHKPDIEVKVEVRETSTYISCAVYKGSGGLPVGTGGKVVLMLSGGIDSPVAGYLAMKRGVKIEAIHFHSPPYTNERAKQKVIDLTKVLTEYGGKIRLHVVPFTKTQMTIHKNIPSNYTMTIMRRMMLRISERIAQEQKAFAITTGESLGQVASQTLHSMHTINEVTNMPMIRPLVTMDKLEVIELAQKIGTYDLSILPYEDCCTIFLPPETKTKPTRDKANLFEEKLDIEALVQEAVSNVEIIDIFPTKETDNAFGELL